MESMPAPFTLTIDWLAFTLSKSSVDAVSQVLGCEWVQGEGGFRGYPHCWIYVGSSGGGGKLGTQAPRKPQEVRVDLSAGIVSTWPFEKVQRVLNWIVEQQGHLTRIDYAFDDRQALVSLDQIKQAIDAGHRLTRAEVFTRVHGGKIHTGISTGETL
jgi:phage replication initiation protein